jgi:cobalamin synthase
VAFVVARLAKAKISGQTGDVLGATQVLAETAILLWLIV